MKRSHASYRSVALLFLTFLSAPAVSDKDQIVGTWLTGDGDDRWTDGKIYDPNSGKMYRCIITAVDDNTLKMRGYIGVPKLGRTEIWTRKKE